MNFKEMQVIWDSQQNRKLYATDEAGMQRLIDQESNAVKRDLDSLEFAAIVALIGLGIAATVDTFFNGQEYFQLFGVTFDFSAAGYLLLRRRKRKSESQRSESRDESRSLMDLVEDTISKAKLTIQCGRDLALVFSLFALYGVVVRILIYGWRGSEIKLVAAIFCVVFLCAMTHMNEKHTHTPRLQRLQTLLAKLREV